MRFCNGLGRGSWAQCLKIQIWTMNLQRALSFYKAFDRLPFFFCFFCLKLPKMIPFRITKAMADQDQDQACTGIEELVEAQAFKRSIIAFLFTNLLWCARGSPSFTHSSYFSNAATMSLKSGRFDGFAAQHRLIRWASAG